MKARLPIEVINSIIPTVSLLTALRYIKNTILFGKTRRTAVVFICKCGGHAVLNPNKVIKGYQKSCGCLTPGNRKYNSYSPKLRRVYYAMISRCYNKNDSGYKWYGGRGVRVCLEWRSNPQKFFDWAIGSGYKEGLCLDKDMGGGKMYSPNKCCWVTHKVNCKHRRQRSPQKLKAA